MGKVTCPSYFYDFDLLLVTQYKNRNDSMQIKSDDASQMNSKL